MIDILEYCDEHNVTIDLCSDQTSCHAVYEGGYTPQGLSYDDAMALLKNDPPAFKSRVDECTPPERGD